MAITGNYLPLTRYLEQLPAKQASVELTFLELEALLGYPLPPTARLHHFWRGSGTVRGNWVWVGFTARLRLRPLTVVFTRRSQS